MNYHTAWAQAVSPHIAPRESEAGFEMYCAFNPGTPENSLLLVWHALGSQARAMYATAESRARSTDPLRALAQALADAPTDSTRADCWAALCDYLEAMPRSPK